MFIIGTGKRFASLPPIYLNSDSLADSADALATARETPKIAFAPRFDFVGVPSRSIIS